MKAAIVREHGSIAVEDVDVDDPGPREVLVRTAAAGVCHSDIGYLDGSFATLAPPFVLGHEAGGVVERVGADVRHVAPGDHVVTCLSLFCGQCDACLTGHAHLCARLALEERSPDTPRLAQGGRGVPQMTGLGAFAEQMLVHENSLVKISRDMPLDRAALLGCGVTTGLGAVFYAAKVPPCATVAVLGCGGVGLSVVQGARISGASRIIAVDRVRDRLALAQRLGATDVVDASEGDAVQRVLELTAGGVKYSFEVAGHTETAEQAFAMLAPGGTATVVGVVFGKTLSIPTDLLRAERRIQGSLMGSTSFRVAIPRYVDLYLQGKLLLDELVTQRCPLADIDTALAPMLRNEGARSMIVFDGAGPTPRDTGL